MKSFFKALTISLLFTILTTCKDQSTDPQAEQIKDPREMTWTADTVKIPDTAIQLLPEDMLVVSSTDIWLAFWVGHGQIWHYDGKVWAVVEDIGGEVNCLFKKSDTELWAGGRIGRYYGNNVAVANYKNGVWTWNEMSIEGEILDMCTDPQGNVWACGRNGLIMKYTDSKWIADTIKVGYNQAFSDSEYLLRSVQHYKDKIYSFPAVYDTQRKKNIYYYATGDIKNWTILDSMVLNSPNSIIKWGNWGLHLSNDNKLYSYGLEGIWRYEDDQWKQIYHLGGEMYGMHSEREDYILGVSAFNKIFFYDGSSWELISDIFKTNDPYFVYNNVTMVDKEIYVCGYGRINNKDVTIVWHGK